MAQSTLNRTDHFWSWFLVVVLALIALCVLSGSARAGHCRQFFYQPAYVQQVQQVVYPAVSVSPYIYQAGRDIEADALAAKVARLVVPQIVQQLRMTGLTQQQALPNSIASQRCAKCHSGAAPKAGLLLDGTTALLPHQITATIRAVRDDKMPKGGPPLTAEQKGLLLEELLSLEADRTRPTVLPPPAPQPQTQPLPGELK
jgi:hypothetical protein